VKYSDADLAALADGLAKALPNRPIINIVGASADEQRLLVIAGGDTDPGIVYRYDKARRDLQELLPVCQYRVDRPTGQISPVTFVATDEYQATSLYRFVRM